MSDNGVILEARDVVKHFPVKKGLFGAEVGRVRAVDGVSFVLRRGETLGLVGESGCGKTTLGRCVLRLEDVTSGHVAFEGRDITQLGGAALRGLRRDMQVVFQDPYSSLNPRMTIRDIVGESLGVHGVARGREIDDRVAELLDKVGLPPRWMGRYPHEFSGGQRQRIGIARAIALNPKFIVCDEPVSALDVSIQAQVLNLLMDLRRDLDLSYLFIAHNLAVVKHIANRIAVMYLGQIVETAETEALFDRPVHPYTRCLMSAIPNPNPRARSRRLPLRGDVPSPMNPPTACRFHTRCPAVMDICRREAPKNTELEDGRRSALCYLAYDLPKGLDWYDALEEKTQKEIAKNQQTESRQDAKNAKLDQPAFS